MKYLILVLFLISPNTYVISQANYSIAFNPIFQKAPLTIDEEDFSDNGFNIETLKFYISNVQLFSDGDLKWSEEHSYHLINASDPSSMLIELLNNKETIDSISFLLGIDSITNVSGALGGDLDPTKGMYWTWQNGYINFKLEGVHPDCPARNNYFQYHLGGYMAPFLNAQPLGFRLTSQNLILDINLDNLFKQCDVSATYAIMSPGRESLKMANLIATIFEQRH